MKRYSNIYILFFFLNSLFAAQAQMPAGNELSGSDSLWRVSLPELRLPAQYRNLTLPAIIDNSQLPYFRPIFNQSSASCGQAAGVAYNFTYEMCRRRNVWAGLPENQFPSHFAYNFMNYNGYYGVNYFHSFEILKSLGTPTVAEYGGIAVDDGNMWLSGYDNYRNAMRNRLKAVHRINAGNPEGFLTLKHWLVHHLDGSETGGVANFNAASPWGMVNLPPGTPEAGKKAIVQFQGTQATHAMTIVGYNDSIRYDYNQDGQYTNHLDINGDGMVDMRDWEWGAFKVANSYGSNWGNDGYFYMMYRLLAENVYSGGIWNHQVDVLELHEPYEPLMTIRTTVKHNLRERVKIVAGISTDTLAAAPEYLLHFPVFDYQGGPQFMQGGNSDPENQTIEIGLDITPLLQYIQSGQAARFFVEIHENDPFSHGDGELIQFAVRQYNGTGVVEIASLETAKPLVNNGITRMSVVCVPVFDQPLIITEQLPVFNAGTQLEASGGTPPYIWTLEPQYHQQIIQADFPSVNEEQLILQAPNNKFAFKQLPFSFPFDGELYNEVYVHKDGFILFEPEIFPWPYYQDTYLLFRTMRNISAFLMSPVKYHPGTKQPIGMWYEGDAGKAAFRWKQPLVFYDKQVGYGEFAVVLYPDGSIEFYYNDIEVTEEIRWYAGVSTGEGSWHQLVKNANSRNYPSGKSYRFVPELIPQGVGLSNEGFLWGMPDNTEEIVNLKVGLTDDRGLKTSRTFSLGDVLVFTYNLSVPEGQTIQNGVPVSIDLEVTNLLDIELNAVTANLVTNDPHWTINVNTTQPFNLPPGGNMQIENAFQTMVNLSPPDAHTMLADLSFALPFGTRTGKVKAKVKAAEIEFVKATVNDNDNSRLDPGETAPINLLISNNGAVTAQSLTATLVSLDPLITVHSPQVYQFEPVCPSCNSSANFILSAASGTAVGHIANLELQVADLQGNSWNLPFSLKIGQYPLLVFRRATNSVAANAILNTLDQLEIEYTYTTTLPSELENYRAVMVIMGSVGASTSLTQQQINTLVEFLDKGGRLYMEGNAVWAFSRPPVLYERFKVAGSNLSPPIFTQTLSGYSSTFASGMSFPFNGTEGYVFFQVAPLEGAIALFHPAEQPSISVMTSYAGNNYKTIAASVEFSFYGGAGNQQERKELMTAILTYFDLGYLLTNVPQVTLPDEQRVSIQPNPFNSDVMIQFQSKGNSAVLMSLFATDGRIINQFLETNTAESQHLSFRWNGADKRGNQVSPGVYLLRIQQGEMVLYRKLIRL